MKKWLLPTIALLLVLLAAYVAAGPWLAIRGISEAIEQRDGAKFDIKSFHDHAIGHGQIPLPVFEAEMPNWVKPTA